MLASLYLSLSGFRAAASFCRPTSGYRHVAEAAVDSLCLGVPELPEPSSRVCSRFHGPHQGFSCLGFLSLVGRRELCRYTSGSAGVAKLAPCPICLPSSPARYALGVGERCAGWSASQWHAIPGLGLRLHQQLALSSSALSHKPIGLALSREAPQGSLLAFASGNVVGEPTQPVSPRLPRGLRFLPDLTSASSSIHLTAYFPFVGGDTDLV